MTLSTAIGANTAAVSASGIVRTSGPASTEELRTGFYGDGPQFEEDSTIAVPWTTTGARYTAPGDKKNVPNEGSTSIDSKPRFESIHPDLVQVDLAHESIKLNGSDYTLLLLSGGASKYVYEIEGTDLVFKTNNYIHKYVGLQRLKQQLFSQHAYDVALQNNLVVPEIDVSSSNDRSMLIAPKVTPITGEYYRDHEKSILCFYKKIREARLIAGDARAANIANVNGTLKLLDSDLILPFDEAGGSDFTDGEIYTLYRDFDGAADVPIRRLFSGIQHGVRLPPDLTQANFPKIVLRFLLFAREDMKNRLEDFYTREQLEAEMDKMLDNYFNPTTLTSKSPHAFLLAISALGGIAALMRARRTR